MSSTSAFHSSSENRVSILSCLIAHASATDGASGAATECVIACATAALTARASSFGAPGTPSAVKQEVGGRDGTREAVEADVDAPGCCAWLRERPWRGPRALALAAAAEEAASQEVKAAWAAASTTRSGAV